MHDTPYHVVLSGDAIKVHDWVVLVRDDFFGGPTGCQGAANIAGDSTHNDFIYGNDNVDNPDHDDLGGLVRSADLDNDGNPEVFIDIQLRSEIDGRTAPDLSYPTMVSGMPVASSSFTVCLANEKAYSFGNPPPVSYTHLTLPTTD